MFSGHQSSTRTKHYVLCAAASAIAQSLTHRKHLIEIVQHVKGIGLEIKVLLGPNPDRFC